MNIEFQQLNEQLLQWQALQPLKREDQERLWQKLRLDWNYHSNHLEGNTLTYGETEILLFHHQVTGDHKLRDYVEMQAHDVAIAHLTALTGDQRPLSEVDVRDFNRILLKESFWKDAITPDGQPSRIEILPGEYKKQPNNVKTASGDIFHFADPADVPIRMGELIAWLRDALDAGDLHPIEIASRLHHDFVLIHPFGDGNGRTARLLVNHVLMRKGYLPLIVPTEQKDRYLAALRAADAGNLDVLTSYLAACLGRSMELGIRAANGESIQEQDDLLKEIEVLKRRQKGDKKEVVAKSNASLQKLYHESLRPLMEDFVTEMSRLDDLFAEVSITTSANSSSDRSWQTHLDDWATGNNKEETNHLALSYILKGYRGEAAVPFNVSEQVAFQLSDFHYWIMIGGKRQKDRLYSEALTDTERKSLARSALESAFAAIKRDSGQE
jgi:Fic family protein